MRTKFIEYLCDLAEHDKSIVLVVGDLGYSVVEKFQDRFPERFFNAGVAEQGMMGLAAGLASEGYRVFAYSLANFPTFRAAEQIRNDIDYHQLPVTIVSVGGGLSYGNLGYSHHAIQDYGLMRLFPNMAIAAPADPIEVEYCMDQILESSHPYYLRLGKTGEPNFNLTKTSIKKDSLNLIEGNANSSTAIVSTGAAIQYAKNFYDNLDLNTAVLFTMPIWGMQVGTKTIEQLARYKRIYIYEDHIKSSGFGSWVLENLNEYRQRGSIEVFLRGLSVQVFGAVGTQSELNDLGGLSDGS